jgi:hypothetical protein
MGVCFSSGVTLRDGFNLTSSGLGVFPMKVTIDENNDLLFSY